MMNGTTPTRMALRLGAALCVAATCLLVVPGSRAQGAGPLVFGTPEDAARELTEVVKANDLDRLIAIFGQAGQDLVDTSDVATGRRNREVLVVAAAEGWRVVDLAPGRKELVLGNEAWPFPAPIVKGPSGWYFDAVAGREEILNRRIGRNELAVIRTCRTYVTAQRAYASTGHDGKPAGLFARRFASTPGAHDGLYWPARPGAPRSPLGTLIAKAAEEGYSRKADGEGPSPLYGYYFRTLEGQGPAATGGAADYVVNGEMSGGFALVAWPVFYDASGVMTFIVNQDGIVYQKDLGPDTAAAVKAITKYDPDATWLKVQP